MFFVFVVVSFFLAAICPQRSCMDVFPDVFLLMFILSSLMLHTTALEASETLAYM